MHTALQESNAVHEPRAKAHRFCESGDQRERTRCTCWASWDRAPHVLLVPIDPQKDADCHCILGLCRKGHDFVGLDRSFVNVVIIAVNIDDLTAWTDCLIGVLAVRDGFITLSEPVVVLHGAARRISHSKVRSSSARAKPLDLNWPIKQNCLFRPRCGATPSNGCC